jgi:tight adherence protein B
MRTAVVPLVAFLVGTLAVAAIAYALVRLPALLERRRLDRRLREFDERPGMEERAKPTDLIKGQVAGPVPAFDRLIGRTARGSALARWVEQSGLRLSLSAVVLVALVMGALLGTVTAALVRAPLSFAIGAVVGFALPFAVVKMKRRGRLRRFEEEFPEALDLVSRALKAGHAFSAGLKMVADEMGDPVGPEFRKTFDEQNFGLPLKDALNNMADRVPSLDVRFFVTAVLIQRDTGGNLSEILENLAHVVRERFKILRQVRVHTAHGRLTGYVLLGLPVALSIALMFINPEHMNMLFRESMGQTMLIVAMVMQTVGYFWISRVVKIEV